jgi:hypothetical protein
VGFYRQNASAAARQGREVRFGQRKTTSPQPVATLTEEHRTLPANPYPRPRQKDS